MFLQPLILCINRLFLVDPLINRKFCEEEGMNSDFDIIEVSGRDIFDSEGLPAVEAEVILENGARGRASCILAGNPAGFSRREPSTWMNCTLGEAVLFEDASNQRRIDHILTERSKADGKESEGQNKNYINLRFPGCISAVSMAVSRAAAAGHMMPLYRYLGGIAPGSLPVPLVTVLHSGAGETQEAAGTENQWEEFLVAPLHTSGFSDGFHQCVKVYHTLKKLLTLCGDGSPYLAPGGMGGFLVRSQKAAEAKDYVSDAMKLCGCRPEKDMTIISNRDMAGGASLFGPSGPAVITIEQAVTVTMAIDSVEKARKDGKSIIVSHGSRETEDTYMADFAAALRADFMKMGGPCHAGSLAKYNEMVRLEEWIKLKTLKEVTH